jgi:hypothetical protein
VRYDYCSLVRLWSVQLGLLQEEISLEGTADLAEVERYELSALLQIYQLGQLRKSEAIVESTKRGFPLQQLMTES